MTREQAIQECLILGVPVTCFSSLEGAAEAAVRSIRAHEKSTWVAINPEKVCFAHRDRRFHQLLVEANFHICDGAGTALAARLLKGRRIPRVTGVDLFYAMLAAGDREELSVFVLGATREVNERAVAKMRREYPGLRVVDHRDGFFTPEEETDIVARINASRADMLFVALGSPRQERWMARHRAELAVPFCLGVGGSLDVFSGTVRRAPPWCRRWGLEWLYRLGCDPRRWRRQLALPRFAWEVLCQMVAPRAWTP